MQRLLKGETFSGMDDRGESTIENLELIRCRFDDCFLSLTDDPTKRSLVRHVRLTECLAHRSVIYSATIEDVCVDGLRTKGLLQVWAATFRRVVLKGRIGRIMISPFARLGKLSPEKQHAFDRYRSSFYEETDWALDISEAQFEEFSSFGIPARLIRRDVETQVVVTKARALEGRWKDIDLFDTPVDVSLRLLSERVDEDTVLVAPKTHPSFQATLEAFRRLRGAGIAEPD